MNARPATAGFLGQRFLPFRQDEVTRQQVDIGRISVGPGPSALWGVHRRSRRGSAGKTRLGLRGWRHGWPRSVARPPALIEVGSHTPRRNRAGSCHRLRWGWHGISPGLWSCGNLHAVARQRRRNFRPWSAGNHGNGSAASRWALRWIRNGWHHRHILRRMNLGSCFFSIN